MPPEVGGGPLWVARAPSERCKEVDVRGFAPMGWLDALLWAPPAQRRGFAIPYLIQQFLWRKKDVL